MRVGVACEGRTDFVLLSEVIISVFGPGEVVALQPIHDALRPSGWGPGGWTLVKRWCEARQDDGGLAEFMELSAYDVIVVQVDGDLCGREGLPASRPALCDRIKQSWIGPPGVPPGVVICIPAPSTDAWLAAALDPGLSGDGAEAHPAPVELLAPHGITKSAPLYREKAPLLAARLADLCGAVSELGRFVGKLEACRG